jgi:hypothetical protein
MCKYEIKCEIKYEIKCEIKYKIILFYFYTTKQYEYTFTLYQLFVVSTANILDIFTFFYLESVTEQYKFISFTK